MKMISKYTLLPILVGCLLLVVSAQAQRGGFDRSQFMDRMTERIQETLEVSDDEWTVLKPLIVRVIEQQFANRGNRFAGFGGGRGRGGNDGNRERGNRGERGERGGDNNNSSTVNLREAIKSGNDDKIKSELAAYRAAQKKRADELKKVRNDLRQVLTFKQEANLVLMGLLD
ncbi:MAG: hypothetical protein M2R45_00029 [Verrucomicrobia subdivision 3 bacterium]|nr:hypothetical protein [Limisphaerales bacterium]MCS1412512.1 hypothetical protein [Limisphaerales bacterium]